MAGESILRSRRVFLFALFLLLAGLASSVYLTELFVRVHNPAGEPVESFCAVSEGVNCVSVAASRYATVLGIPVSVYGIEFFLAGLAILIAARLRPSETGDSLLWWASLLGVLVSIALAGIAVFSIRSICIMCCAVYAVNVLLAVTVAIAGRRKLGSLFAAGPAGALRWAFSSTSSATLSVLAVVVAALQFAVLPPLFRYGGNPETGPARRTWQGLPAEGMSLGDPSAPVRIEEFTDFQCPFCAKGHFVLLDLIRKYPDRVYIEHRDLPLDMSCNPHLRRPFHTDSCRAARYARCAANQDAFWELEETLFRNRRQLSEPDLKRYAADLDIDHRRFEACLEDPETLRAIRADIEEAQARGIRGTPTFFVNGERVAGYKPLAFWEEKLSAVFAPDAGAPRPSNDTAPGAATPRGGGS